MNIVFSQRGLRSIAAAVGGRRGLLAGLLGLVLLPLIGCRVEPPTAAVRVELPERQSVTAIEVSRSGRYLLLDASNGDFLWDLWRNRAEWMRKGLGTKRWLPGEERFLSLRLNTLPPWSAQLRRRDDAEILAELVGAPITHWRKRSSALSPSGRYFAVLSEQLDLAVYDLSNVGSGPTPVTLEPRLLRTGSQLDDSSSGRTLGFNADETQVFLLAVRSRVIERWSLTDPPKRAGLTGFGHGYRPGDGFRSLWPHSLTPDGRYGWNCERQGMQMAPAEGRATMPISTFNLNMKFKEGAWVDLGYGVCGLSDDGQWAAFGLRQQIDGRGSEPWVDYKLAIWRRDGSVYLEDFDPNQRGSLSDAPVHSLQFSPDQRMLYVLDRGMGLHWYSLQDPAQRGLIEGPELGLLDSHVALLRSTPAGVAVSHWGAKRVVWLPREVLLASPNSR